MALEEAYIGTMPLVVMEGAGWAAKLTSTNMCEEGVVLKPATLTVTSCGLKAMPTCEEANVLNGSSETPFIVGPDGLKSRT